MKAEELKRLQADIGEVEPLNPGILESFLATKLEKNQNFLLYFKKFHIDNC